VEVPYKSGPPDGQRYPDFSQYRSESVKIDGMRGVSEDQITPPETGDFSKAWESLEQQKGKEYIENTYGISQRTKGIRNGTWPNKSPRRYTWHHNGDISTMELVDLEVHDVFKHKGGASAVRN